VIIFLCIAVSENLAKTIKVPEQSATIQQAIDNSQHGDTVLVDPGEYFENINFAGKNIVVASNFILSGDRSLISSTIINGSQPTNNNKASCVLFISGETRDAVLEGFTLTGGTGTLWTDEHGAGNYFEGGGILIALCSPTIRNNIIEGNAARRPSTLSESSGGGGIRAGDGNPLIINNIIRNNSGLYGGGIVMNYTNGTIKNNLIYNNVVKELNPRSQTFGGGGLWINTCDTVYVENNTIINNSSSGGGTFEGAGHGGGVSLLSSKPTFKNNIVWGNKQTSGTSFYEFGPRPSVIQYNNFEETRDGVGNISVDPLFEGDNFLLNDNSPSIDAGDPAEIYYDKPDESNPGMPAFPSKGTRTNDQGVFGGPNALIVRKAPTKVSEEIIGNTASNFNILKNYPNPFNPSTTFEFSLIKKAEVSVTIYNSTGQKIHDLLNKSLDAGFYTKVYQPGNLSSGVYTAVLSIDGQFKSASKIILLK
jgi:hypothetical protein